MTTGSNPAKSRVYLDHNATSPISEKVRERVPVWLEEWGNPSSIHYAGRGPKALIRKSREAIAATIGASSPLELIFTAGGSEANNLALKGVFDSFLNQANSIIARKPRNRFLISSVEHPSIKRTAEYLKARGADVQVIPVLRTGAIDLETYKALLNEDTALVSVMLANNETGNLFPVKEMAKMAHDVGALFHSDCVQALGKIELNVRDLGVDLATFSGHKFYALKGCGVLYARRGLNLESLIHGGGQERHRRGGTENALAIAALGAMCEQRAEIAPQAERLRKLRDRFEERVLAEISEASLTGAESPRLPNTSSLVLPGVDGEILLMNLDMRGFAVSTGAACSSGSPEPSPVLLAMGLSRGEAQASLRVGLGWSTTEQQIEDFTDALVAVVKHLRSVAESQRKAFEEEGSYVGF